MNMDNKGPKGLVRTILAIKIKRKSLKLNDIRDKNEPLCTVHACNECPDFEQCSRLFKELEDLHGKA